MLYYAAIYQGISVSAHKMSENDKNAAAMFGKQKRFVKFLVNHIGRLLLSFHCIIHHESLCAKISLLDLRSVMETVVKIVNFIVSHSSLIYRQFKSLLQEIESEYGDMLLHSSFHWLSQGEVLNIFVSCLEAVYDVS